MERYTLIIRNAINKRKTEKKVELVIETEEQKETLVKYLRYIKILSINTDYILQKTLNF